MEDWPPSPAILAYKTTAQLINGIPVSSVQILTEKDNNVAVKVKQISKCHATRKIYMVRKEGKYEIKFNHMYMSFPFMDHTLLLTADTV